MLLVLERDDECKLVNSILTGLLVSSEDRVENKPPFSFRDSVADRLPRVTDSCLACRTASSIESSAIAKGYSEEVSQSSARVKDPFSELCRKKEFVEKASIKFNNGSEIFLIL